MLNRLLKSSIILSAVLLLTGCEEPEAIPAIVFVKTFGGDRADVGNWVEQSDDGGYIIVGQTLSFGAWESDIWLIKTDASGDSIWSKMFGSNEWDNAYCVQQTFDGGYIIAGGTSASGNGDIWLIRTDAAGDTLWTKTFGGDNSEVALYVQQTDDMGYIIAGNTKSYGSGGDDFYIVKTDVAGDTLWTRTYGGGSLDRVQCVQQTTDGGYIILGNTLSFGSGSDDAWLIKTDAFGNIIWSRTYGGSSSDGGYSIEQIQEGGFIIAGGTLSFGAGYEDVWLIRTNSIGDTLWTKTLGGANIDGAHSIQRTADMGYIICGMTCSFGDGIWLIKTDASGDTLWTRVLGNTSIGRTTRQTKYGGYIITGSISVGRDNTDLLLIKTDEYGYVE